MLTQNRNTTSETPPRSKPVFVTPILYITWSAATTRRSTSSTERIRCVGTKISIRNFSLEDVHIEGTERIVEATAKYDVDRYVHVSSHSADPNSISEFYATKGRGEQIARSLFPETTLVRPAPMFGTEDDLLLKLASALNLFTANNMEERFWPVHVGLSRKFYAIADQF